MNMLRRTGELQHRCNNMAETPKTFYKVSICIPFLNSTIIIIHYSGRLLKHKRMLSRFKCVLPYNNEVICRKCFTNKEQFCNGFFSK